MTITEIKNRLSITQVLSHYGLKSNKNGMLCCPFHEDQKASMKVYVETNTVYCFAGTCEVEYLDQIDFILHREKCSKHEAIEKAKSLCGDVKAIKKSSSPNSSKPKLKSMKAPHPATAFKSYHKSLHHHKLSQEYCESRCLDWRLLEIGYKSRKSSDKWGRGCIIFPLLNWAGDIVSLYGRGISSKGHYYQTGRNGLYPGYPSKSVRVLVLCESIIDAATLTHVDLGLEDSGLLALYGVNGLTEEHLKAISQLPELEEIIFALDSDAAGEAATRDHARTLGRLHPQISLSYLALPRNEDINSMAVGHEHYPALFKKLISERKLLQGTAKKAELVESQKEEPVAVFDSSDADNLSYQTSLATYYIKGGIRSGTKDLGHMKVTLVVENRKGKKSRNGLDLYEDRQIEKIARHVSDRLGLRADLVELDLHGLTDELERYRKRIMEDGANGEVKLVPVSASEEAKYISFWKSKKLLEKIDEYLEQYGIIGEYNNRLLGFCIASSSQMCAPLHGLIQGSSGSGKTHLLSALCALIPPEYYISITRATDNSFYNYQRYDLKNKLISIEDKDSMSEEANLAFRELQSKGMVSLSTTGQDERGHNRSYVKEVYGPIASLACTTRGEVYLDDMNRCFLLAVDESEDQTDRILLYQKRAAAGEVQSVEKEKIAAFMQGALRMLKSDEVVIPQATKISLPEDVKDKRRLNSLYLSLVKQITLLHQYQRSKDETGRLVATKIDLQIANEIMFDAIVLKVDDLHGPLRSFYEKLKAYLKEVAGDQAEKYEFVQRELRHWMHRSNTYVKRHLRSLQALGYLVISGGSEYRGHRYQLVYWDDNEALRSRIKKYLDNQINGLD